MQLKSSRDSVSTASCGRLFHILAVDGRNEWRCASIREGGNMIFFVVSSAGSVRECWCDFRDIDDFVDRFE